MVTICYYHACCYVIIMLVAMLLSCLLLDKYILSLICIARINFSEQPHIKGKAWDAVRSPFRAIHINESKIVVDLVRWRHYSITLKNPAILGSHHNSCFVIDIIACKDQRQNLQIINYKILQHVNFHCCMKNVFPISCAPIWSDDRFLNLMIDTDWTKKKYLTLFFLIFILLPFYRLTENEMNVDIYIIYINILTSISN
jgi:hypothetical protein